LHQNLEAKKAILYYNTTFDFSDLAVQVWCFFFS